ncbi:MAG: O-antigen ligase family protein [Dysgonomonas mossii]
MIALASLAIIISYLINKISLKYSITDLLIFSFCIIGVAVTYLNNQAITTLLILFVLLFVLYFYFRIFLFQYKSNLYILSVFLILTGGIEAIWGLRQLYGFIPSLHGLFNVTGSFFNPGPYAGYLSMILPMTLYYILRDWSVVYRKFRRLFIPFYIRCSISIFSFVCIILILPATMSRASWLAAIGGCLLVLGLFARQKRQGLNEITKFIRGNKIKTVSISLGSTLFIILCLWGVYYLKKDSADGRALIWKISVETIYKYPIGVGLGNFSGSYGEQQATYFRSGKATEQEILVAGNPEYAFNEFIQILVELGVIPFILMIFLFLSVIVSGIQMRRIGAVGSIIALLIFASMSYPFNVLPFLIVLVLLISICVSKRYVISYYQDLHNFYIHDFQIRYRRNQGSILCILLVSCIITAFYLNNRYPTYRAYQDWTKAQMFYNIKSYENALRVYEKLYPYLNDQTHFLFEYGQCLSKTSHFEESNNVLHKSALISCDPIIYIVIGKNYQALKQYKEAEKYFRKSSYIIPHRMYPHYLLFKLYYETDNMDKAEQTAEQVLNKRIKIDSPAVQDMRKEIKELLATIKE